MNDKFLHFLVGFTIYMFFSFYKVNRTDKLLIVLMVALSKESIDIQTGTTLVESAKDVMYTILGPLMLVRFF